MIPVTVIIPVYNRVEELRRALCSLNRQSFSDFFVIVCDDGSSEDISGAISIFQNQTRIKTIRCARSGGPAHPRNIGLNAARSEWISFLDSDDWWRESKLERVQSTLVDSVDLVYHKLTVCEESRHLRKTLSNRRSIGRLISRERPFWDLLVNGNGIPMSSVTVRRQSMLEIGGFDEGAALKSVEDIDAWLRLAKRRARFRFIDEPMGFYKPAADSISKFSEQQYECHKSLFERHLETLFGIHRIIAENRVNYLLGSYALALGKEKYALEHFRGIRLHRSPRLWLFSRLKIAIKRRAGSLR